MLWNKTQTMENKGDVPFHVYYGANGVDIDVTFDTLQAFAEGNQLRIPGQNKILDLFFSDPLHGVAKRIRLEDGDERHTFEANVWVHYKCTFNGPLFAIADTLRANEDIRDLDFAMQTVLALSCKPQTKLLKIGARYGMTFATKEADINLTVLEADYETVMRAASANRSARFRMCASAFAYKDVILKGRKLVSLDACQQELAPTPVMLHSSTLEVKQLPQQHSVLSNELGLKRDTLETLQAKVGFKFDTIAFDGCTSLADVLRDAAPLVLRHVQTLIVCVNLAHREARSYVHNQLTIFKFRNVAMHPYRNTHMFEVWQATQ